MNGICYSNDIFPDQRVMRGAAWLDTVKPGWHELVDTSDFHVFDPKRCVLGQVFREEADAHPDYSDGYTFAWEQRGLTSHNITAFGFCTGGGFNSSELNKAWTIFITARQHIDAQVFSA